MRLETGIQSPGSILRTVERGEGRGRRAVAFVGGEVARGPYELVSIHAKHADVIYGDVESLHLRLLQSLSSSWKGNYLGTA